MYSSFMYAREWVETSRELPSHGEMIRSGNYRILPQVNEKKTLPFHPEKKTLTHRASREKKCKFEL